MEIAAAVGLFKTAKDAVSGLQTTPVIRERLSLALDQASLLESKIADLQSQVGELRAEVKIARANEKEAKLELDAVKKEHEEEIVISETVEFRRGKRTGKKWLPFCPKCHSPAGAVTTAYGSQSTDPMYCTAHCGWYGTLAGTDLVATIARLPAN